MLVLSFGAFSDYLNRLNPELMSSSPKTALKLERPSVAKRINSPCRVISVGGQQALLFPGLEVTRALRSHFPAWISSKSIRSPAAQFLHVKLSNLPTKVTKAVYSTPLLPCLASVQERRCVKITPTPCGWFRSTGSNHRRQRDDHRQGSIGYKPPEEAACWILVCGTQCNILILVPPYTSCQHSYAKALTLISLRQLEHHKCQSFLRRWVPHHRVV